MILKGYEVEVDSKASNLNKKIRKAQLEFFNFIVIIGEEEVRTRTIAVRARDGQSDRQTYQL